jgi:hypothetical protein
LPVPGNHELSAIQKLDPVKEGPGKIGAVEHRLEKVRSLQVGAGQLRARQVRPSEIGVPKISLGKIETAQVEASQTGPSQVRRFVNVVRAPDREIALTLAATSELPLSGDFPDGWDVTEVPADGPPTVIMFD